MRLKKNIFVPWLLLTLGWWAALGWLLIKVEPKLVADLLIPNGQVVFFVLVYLVLFFTSELVLNTYWRSGLWALFLTGQMWLYYWHLFNWLNLGLSLMLLILVEWYVYVGKKAAGDGGQNLTKS